MDKAKWQKVKKGFNINELLKYRDIVPCIIGDKPEVKGEYLIYYAEDGCCGSCGIAYKCKLDGTIVEVYW